MKVAFCHPVIFGETDLSHMSNFLDYYRKLGFDRFFFWSEPNAELEEFFQQQFDVTFAVYDESYEIETYGFFYYPEGYKGQEKGRHIVLIIIDHLFVTMLRVVSRAKRSDSFMFEANTRAGL